jgi:hypothetical protein
MAESRMACRFEAARIPACRADPGVAQPVVAGFDTAELYLRFAWMSRAVVHDRISRA